MSLIKKGVTKLGYQRKLKLIGFEYLKSKYSAAPSPLYEIRRYGTLVQWQEHFFHKEETRVRISDVLLAGEWNGITIRAS